MESGYFARNITTILTHGNINPVNVDCNEIAQKFWEHSENLLPRKTVSERVLWFWVGRHFFRINAINLACDSKESFSTVFVANFVCTDAISSDDSKGKKNRAAVRVLGSCTICNPQTIVFGIKMYLGNNLRLSRSNLPTSGLAYLDWNRCRKMQENNSNHKSTPIHCTTERMSSFRKISQTFFTTDSWRRWHSRLRCGGSRFQLPQENLHACYEIFTWKFLIVCKILKICHAGWP